MMAAAAAAVVHSTASSPFHIANSNGREFNLKIAFTFTTGVKPLNHFGTEVIENHPAPRLYCTTAAEMQYARECKSATSVSTRGECARDARSRITVLRSHSDEREW